MEVEVPSSLSSSLSFASGTPITRKYRAPNAQYAYRSIRLSVEWVKQQMEMQNIFIGQIWFEDHVAAKEIGFLETCNILVGNWYAPSDPSELIQSWMLASTIDSTPNQVETKFRASQSSRSIHLSSQSSKMNRRSRSVGRSEPSRRHIRNLTPIPSSRNSDTNLIIQPTRSSSIADRFVPSKHIIQHKEKRESKKR